MFWIEDFSGGVQIHFFQDCRLAGLYQLLQESPPF